MYLYIQVHAYCLYRYIDLRSRSSIEYVLRLQFWCYRPYLLYDVIILRSPESLRVGKSKLDAYIQLTSIKTRGQKTCFILPFFFFFDRERKQRGERDQEWYRCILSVKNRQNSWPICCNLLSSRMNLSSKLYDYNITWGSLRFINCVFLII